MPPDIFPWPCPNPTRATLNIYKAVCKLSSNPCLQFKESSVTIRLPSQAFSPLSCTCLESYQQFLLSFQEGTRALPFSPRWWTEVGNQVLITSHQPVGWVFPQAAFPQHPKNLQSSMPMSYAIIFKSYSSRICIAALFGTQHSYDLSCACPNCSHI